MLPAVWTPLVFSVIGSPSTSLIRSSQGWLISSAAGAPDHLPAPSNWSSSPNPKSKCLVEQMPFWLCKRPRVCGPVLSCTSPASRKLEKKDFVFVACQWSILVQFEILALVHRVTRRSEDCSEFSSKWWNGHIQSNSDEVCKRLNVYARICCWILAEEILDTRCKTGEQQIKPQVVIVWCVLAFMASCLSIMYIHFFLIWIYYWFVVKLWLNNVMQSAVAWWRQGSLVSL